MSILGTPLGLPALLAQAPAGGGSSLAPIAIQFILIIAIIYFIMIRPQQRQRQKHEESLKALKRGDEVVTGGGIIGEIVHIREASKDGGANRMDDRITIKSAESRFVVERRAIQRVVGGTTAVSAKDATAIPPAT
jgi:preprotein translocase subunit YajC